MIISKGEAWINYTFRIIGSKEEISQLTMDFIGNYHFNSGKETDTSYLMEYSGRTPEEAKERLFAKLDELEFDTSTIKDEMTT